MPGDVAARLDAAALPAACDAPPPCQRKDDLGWIARARRLETREQRLAQRLDDLRAGDIYREMTWHGGR